MISPRTGLKVFEKLDSTYNSPMEDKKKPQDIMAGGKKLTNSSSIEVVKEMLKQSYLPGLNSVFKRRPGVQNQRVQKKAVVPQENFEPNYTSMIKQSTINLDSPLLYKILEKDSKRRSPQELEYVKECLSPLEVFKTFNSGFSIDSKEDQLQSLMIYQHLQYKSFQKHVALFYQDDLPRLCYMILQGEVVVLTKDPPHKEKKSESQIEKITEELQISRQEYEKIVGKFPHNSIVGKIIISLYFSSESGKIFGELGLYMNEKRSATVVALSEELKVGCLNAKAFQNTIQAQVGRQLYRISGYLKNMRVFDGIENNLIHQLALNSEDAQRTLRDVLYRPGDDSDYVYFVVSGEIQISQDLTSLPCSTSPKSEINHIKKTTSLKYQKDWLIQKYTEKSNDAEESDKSSSFVDHDIQEIVNLNKFYKPPTLQSTLKKQESQKQQIPTTAVNNRSKVDNPSNEQGVALNNLVEIKQFQQMNQIKGQTNQVTFIVGPREIFGESNDEGLKRTQKAEIISSSAQLIRIKIQVFADIIMNSFPFVDENTDMISALQAKNQRLVKERANQISQGKKVQSKLMEEQEKKEKIKIFEKYSDQIQEDKKRKTSISRADLAKSANTSRMLNSPSIDRKQKVENTQESSFQNSQSATISRQPSFNKKSNSYHSFNFNSTSGLGGAKNHSSKNKRMAQFKIQNQGDSFLAPQSPNQQQQSNSINIAHLLSKNNASSQSNQLKADATPSSQKRSKNIFFQQMSKESSPMHGNGTPNRNVNQSAIQKEEDQNTKEEGSCIFEKKKDNLSELLSLQNFSSYFVNHQNNQKQIPLPFENGGYPSQSGFFEKNSPSESATPFSFQRSNSRQKYLSCHTPPSNLLQSPRKMRLSSAQKRPSSFKKSSKEHIHFERSAPSSPMRSSSKEASERGNEISVSHQISVKQPPSSRDKKLQSVFGILYPEIISQISRQINNYRNTQQLKSHHGSDVILKPFVDTINVNIPPFLKQQLKQQKDKIQSPNYSLNHLRKQSHININNIGVQTLQFPQEEQNQVEEKEGEENNTSYFQQQQNYESKKLLSPQQQQRKESEEFDNQMCITFRHFNLHKIFPESKKSEQVDQYFQEMDKEFKDLQDYEKKNIKIKNARNLILEKIDKKLKSQNYHSSQETFNFIFKKPQERE